MLLRMKFQVMAATVASVWAAANDMAASCVAAASAIKCTTRPLKPDQAEQQKARRDGVVGELGRQQRGKVERDLAVELAFAMAALVKTRRQLDDAQAARLGRQNVEQNLEALRGNRRRQRLEGVAPHHEMAAHRIGEIDAEEAMNQKIGETAGAGALFGEPGRRAAARDNGSPPPGRNRRCGADRAWRGAVSRRAADRRP